MKFRCQLHTGMFLLAGFCLATPYRGDDAHGSKLTAPLHGQHHEARGGGAPGNWNGIHHTGKVRFIYSYSSPVRGKTGEHQRHSAV